MIAVVDASVVAEILLGTASGRRAEPALAGRMLVAPAHLGAEVGSVVRGWSLGGRLPDDRAIAALSELGQLGIEMLDVQPLLGQAWRLRHNLAVYDALYVVLARRLGCELLTLDRRLAAATPDCAVVPS